MFEDWRTGAMLDHTSSTIPLEIGLGGLGVTYSPGDPRFAVSNPTEVDGFFQDVKIMRTTSGCRTVGGEKEDHDIHGRAK